MPITDTNKIYDYLASNNIVTNIPAGEIITELYAYETTSENSNHYDKSYLTAQDIAYYSVKNAGNFVAVFIEDPQILDSENVYIEATG